MLRRVPVGCRLLDVGCGDGSSSMRFANQAGEVLGVDYVSGFVERARSGCALPNVHFEQADVLNLQPVRASKGLFDVVSTIRCLINLTSWEDQEKGLDQIASVVRPGGYYLASEGWREGMEGLNARRARCGLGDISVAQYNLLIDRRRFEQSAAQHFKLVGFEPLGLYLFLSRVLQPVLVAPEAPCHDHLINAVAASLQSSLHLEKDFADCDYAGVYVFQRKWG